MAQAIFAEIAVSAEPVAVFHIAPLSCAEVASYSSGPTDVLLSEMRFARAAALAGGACFHVLERSRGTPVTPL